MSNSQLNKLKSRIKNVTEVTLKLSSNVVGNSNDESNFPHNLLLTTTQVSRHRKALAYSSSTNIKLSETQSHKIEQSREFLGRVLRPLLKTGLPLIKNILKPLYEILLIPLGLTAAVSATDEAIHKKMFGSGCPSDLALRTMTSIILNEQMNDIIKIKSLEESGLLIKGFRETIQNEAKEQKG